MSRDAVVGQAIIFGQPLRGAVAMRSIAFRFEATVTLARATERQPSLPFWTSMKMAVTAMLSQWEAAEAGARFLIQVARKDEALMPDEWSDQDWGEREVNG